MSDPAGGPERFAARLSARVDDRPDDPLSTATVEADGDRARARLRGTDAAFLVEVVPRDVNPLSTDVLERVGEAASEHETAGFAACNAADCFVFGGPSDRTDVHYLDLRDREDAARDVLDAAVHLVERGRLPSQSERERVAGVLRSVQSAIRPRLESLAREARDERFADRFETWLDERDLDADEGFALAAGRYAYLLAAWALHEAIRSDPRAERVGRGVADSFPEGALDSLADLLDSSVGDLLDSLASDPVPDSEGRTDPSPEVALFEAFPHDAGVRRAVADLLSALQRRSLDAVDGDLLGGTYEDLLPAAERRANGQYYTPSSIAETAVRWAIPGDGHGDGETARTDDLPHVLDPAAGTGTFAVEAYRRLAALHPDRDHQDFLDRIVAVDVERVPFLSSALNLACQDAPAATDAVHAHHGSFLDLDPGDLGVAGGDPSGFDAVVGNPPFVRQEHLDKDRFRRHLAAFGGPEAGPDDPPTVSAKSDAYVYFLTQATRFLRAGGRLGFVVPTKWLTTDYGRSFQTFLFEHYRLEAVVGFDAPAFDDALVDAALVLLERCPDPDRRARTATRFVRLDESMSVADVLDAVAWNGDAPPDGEMLVETRPTHRTVALRQSTVAAVESGKLAHFLSAPALAIRLLRHPDLRRLDDLATVAYGNKTGANDFFFLDEADLARWPVDDRFLAPAVRSVREVDARVLTAESTDHYLLDVRSYVERVRRAGGDGPLVERVKRSLSRDGYDALRSYVAHGEREGYPERQTCAARTVWFDLGDLQRPEVVHPKFFDDRIVPLWNRDRLAPSNAVDCLSLRDGVDERIVLGLLQSTVHRVFLECWGRSEGGGALQLMTYEMESLPVVDPATIEGARRDAMVDAVHRLFDGEEAARATIDEVVLDALGLDVDPVELRAVREELSRRRRNGGRPTERVDDVGTRSVVAPDGSGR